MHEFVYLKKAKMSIYAKLKPANIYQLKRIVLPTYKCAFSSKQNDYESNKKQQTGGNQSQLEISSDLIFGDHNKGDQKAQNISRAMSYYIENLNETSLIFALILS